MSFAGAFRKSITDALATAIASEAATARAAEAALAASVLSSGDASGAVAALAATYTPLRERGGQFTAMTAGTRILLPDATPVSAGASSARGAFYLDPADYAAAGRTTHYRLVASLLGNNVGAGVTFTLGLYPLTSPAGAAATVSLTFGTVTTGSTVAFTTPGANAALNDNSGDFTPPAAGFYGIVVVNASGMVASSDVVIRAALQVRQA